MCVRACLRARARACVRVYVCVRVCACMPHSSVVVDQSVDVCYPKNTSTTRKLTAVIAFLINYQAVDKDINIRTQIIQDTAIQV